MWNIEGFFCNIAVCISHNVRMSVTIGCCVHSLIDWLYFCLLAHLRSLWTAWSCFSLMLHHFIYWITFMCILLEWSICICCIPTLRFTHYQHGIHSFLGFFSVILLSYFDLQNKRPFPILDMDIEGHHISKVNIW